MRKKIRIVLNSLRGPNRPAVLLLAVFLLMGLAASGSAAYAREAEDLFPGNPPITPHWAFEPWVWEDETNTQASTEGLVQGYLDRDIPVGAVLVDSPWATYYNTFEWDTTRYPDPAGMIERLHARGVRVLLWITGFINTDAPDYAYVKRKGFTVQNGKNYAWWKGRGVHIDFTNQAALDWWHGRMNLVLDLGIDGWKVDRSIDNLPDPLTTSLGTIPLQDFKSYYYADFFDYSTGLNSQAVSFARPYTSEQGEVHSPVSKLSAGWGGDYSGDFQGLAEQLADVYESARLGYGAPGVEVGGYQDATPSKRSLIRYAQLAALVPIMENGGTNGGESEHLPWFWDDQTVEIYRAFASLHSALSPYLFSYSVEANQSGQSILRETDPDARQHKLGEELFVSALTSDVTSKAVRFPAGGKWVDYWDESITYEGGSSTDYSIPLERYPLFIKAGAVIPMNVKDGDAGQGDNSSPGMTGLWIYPYGESSFTFHRPLGEGIEYEDVRIQVDEAAGRVQVDGDGPAAYRLRIKSFTAPAWVSGADTWSYDAESQAVIVDKQGEDFSVIIQGLQGYGGSTRPGPGAATSSTTRRVGPGGRGGCADR